MIEKVSTVIANSLDLAMEDVTPDTQIRDLVTDSLDLVELILFLEDEFLVDIEDEEINQVATVQDVADLMTQKLSVPPKSGAV